MIYLKTHFLKVPYLETNKLTISSLVKHCGLKMFEDSCSCIINRCVNEDNRQSSLVEVLVMLNQ